MTSQKLKIVCFLYTEPVMCVVEFSFPSVFKPFRSQSKLELCFYTKKKY